MIERNLTICRKCLQIKPRILDGKYNKKDKRFLDDDGGHWNGNICAACHRENVKQRNKTKRSLSKATENESI